MSVPSALSGDMAIRPQSVGVAAASPTKQRLEVIAEMNHHIRNALQVISLTAASTADQKQLDTIRHSMNRIEWALREILPKL